MRSYILSQCRDLRMGVRVGVVFCRGNTVMQFGRAARNEFAVDYCQPLSGIQAFAVAVSACVCSSTAAKPSAPPSNAQASARPAAGVRGCKIVPMSLLRSLPDPEH